MGYNPTVVQDILLKAMDEIHMVCEKAGIVYYLIGGSALGAARHEGFIPWDVDIDIAMHRKDYDRFAEIAEGMLPRGLSYHNHKNTKGYFKPHATISIDNVCAVINSNYYRNEKIEPLFIDVFPLDNAPDDTKLQEKQARELKRIVKIHSRKECVLYKRNSIVHIAIKRIIQGALLPYSLEHLEKKRDTILTRYDALNTKCWCSMVSHYPYSKQCMEKEIYGTPIKVKFNGREYNAPHELDTYLTRIFGKNYMDLPPVEKRIRPDDVIEKIIITGREK